MVKATSKVGKRGTIVIPAALRQRMGLEEGTLVIAEEMDGGVLIRPAVAIAVEQYSPQRRAEFLLNNAVNRKDYDRAVREVRRLGVDPADIPHRKPRD